MESVVQGPAARWVRHWSSTQALVTQLQRSFPSAHVAVGDVGAEVLAAALQGAAGNTNELAVGVVQDS